MRACAEANNTKGLDAVAALLEARDCCDESSDAAMGDDDDNVCGRAAVVSYSQSGVF